MPTISGLRRRGYTPESIRDFCTRIGVAKKENVIDIGLLEHCVREDLNRRAPRAMAVLRPLKVVLTNYPEGQTETMAVVNNPEDAVGRHARGAVLARALHRARRLHGGPAEEVLPPGARAARCGCATPTSSPAPEVVKDAAGEIVELRCTYDPATRGGDAPDGRKVKATLHWVSAAHAVDGEVRLYDRLFTAEDPESAADEGRPDVRRPAEPGERSTCCAAASWSRCWPRPRPARASSSSGSATSPPIPTASPGAPVFNRTVSLKDTWAKVAARRRADDPWRVARQPYGRRPSPRRLDDRGAQRLGRRPRVERHQKAAAAAVEVDALQLQDAALDVHRQRLAGAERRRAAHL